VRNNAGPTWSTFITLTGGKSRSLRTRLLLSPPREASSVELTFNLIKPFFFARDFARKGARFRAISPFRGCRSSWVPERRVKFLRKNCASQPGSTLLRTSNLRPRVRRNFVISSARALIDVRLSTRIFTSFSRGRRHRMNECVGSLRNNVICVNQYGRRS